MLLKDYLRELPDALCTSSLYQMLMDALSVQVPGDNEGNAQLMLSILDCLPRTNQVRVVTFRYVVLYYITLRDLHNH